MAGAIARLVKRFSKNDGHKDKDKDGQRERRHSTQKQEVQETKLLLDVVAQQNERLQAEKVQLAASSTNSLASGPWLETPMSETDFHLQRIGQSLDLWGNPHPHITNSSQFLHSHGLQSLSSTPHSTSHSRPPLGNFCHSHRASLQQSSLSGSSGAGTPFPWSVCASEGLQKSLESDASMAQALLEVLSQLKESGSLVMVACKKGWVEVVKALLQSGVNINEVDQEAGMAPLHVAITHRHSEMVAVLLQNGAFPNLVAANGQTPLQMAVAQGHCAVVAMLVSNGADLDARGITSTSVLHDAAKDGHVEMVRTLLLAGSQLESKDQQGRTALHSAILNGQAGVAEVLIGVGANIHVKSLRGLSMWDALRLAINEGKCSPEASARIQSLLWVSDGVKSRRGSRVSEDGMNNRSFHMGGDT